METKKFQTKLLPVDSEHNAIFQCINCENLKTIKKVILMVVRPISYLKLSEMENVTVDQAVNHPTWDMGKRISIDSASMFNKALELKLNTFLT